MINKDGMPDMPNMAPPPRSDLMNTTGMSNSLKWTTDVTVLFSGWPDDSLGMYVLAFFFIFLLAVAVEVLSVLPKQKQGSNKPLITMLSQTAVNTFRTGLAYLVMLAVMSFNIGILIAAVAGHAIGFFIVKALALGNFPNADEPKV